MPGTVGKILRLDLSSGQISEEKLKTDDLEKYVGSDALAAKLLYNEVPPGTSPLGPENRAIFMTGPLTGTSVQAPCLHSITAKAPGTGFTIGHAHPMGRFGPMLKFSGYDGLVFQGKAEKPVYLWINNGQAEIRDASRLWGKDTFETEDLLREELGQPKLACDSIGPAGESLSAMACVAHDKGHIGGRCGLGAVMGSKNLKAVAVYGTQKVPVAHSKEFKQLASEWRETNMSHPVTKEFSKYGTGAMFEDLYKIGDIPIMNFTRGEIDGWEKLSGRNYIDNMVVKRTLPCWGCTVAHCKLLELRGGVFEGRECELPEFEITTAWGSLIGVTDPTVAAVGGEMADRLGLDSLAAANAIAFAMECYEKGLITTEDTDGIELKFGNWEAAFQMMEKIARREGFGAILADGAYRAAQHIRQGSEKFVVHSKGMALPMHDHRSAWGYAFQYAIGSAGPVHEGGPIFAEMSGKLDRFSTKGKAEAVRAGQITRLFTNNLGVCYFGTFGVSMELMCKTLFAATGFDFNTSAAEKHVMRAVNLRRAFNIRNGLVPEDDDLSDRYTNQPPAEGGAKGSAINVKPMRQEYYDLMGWDQKTGKPFRRTLEELDLEDVAKDLWD